MNSACYYKNMNNQEYYDYEDRRYVNPVTSRDEQLTFANNLRSVANNDIAKIKADTYNLGTHVPSNLGGLTGSTGLWTRNYVSPKVESMTQGLRAVAQSSALENAMNNYLNQTKQKYQNAYRAAAKRARSSGSGGGGYYSTGGTGGAGNAIQAYLDWLAQQGFDTTEDPSGTGDDNPEPPTTQQGINGTAVTGWGNNTLGGTIGGIAGAGIGSMIPVLGPVVGGGLGGALGSWIGSNWGK